MTNPFTIDAPETLIFGGFTFRRSEIAEAVFYESGGESFDCVSVIIDRKQIFCRANDYRESQRISFGKYFTGHPAFSLPEQLEDFERHLLEHPLKEA
ncbi:hypothetical protein Dxin01_02878 [Deinococcus xinjiangensis]|uniref:Uncharacterized protein n=1 Tax=Deinococcus xinjiangensis TaxID=457454 RepID=A0ABP9VD19_9DEIO